MLGKTHMMVGIAASLALTHPDTISGMVTAAGVGAVGALISDIDVGTSNSHKDADRVVGLTAVVIAVVMAADLIGQFGIMQRILNNSGIVRVIVGCLLFIGTCAFGKEQPHRSFMHSFLALAILAFSLGLIYPKIIPYFVIGFLSHLATDIFNRRKVRLLYPLKGGFSLNLFHAKGIANTIFFTAGCTVTAIEVALMLIRMVHIRHGFVI